MTSMPLNMSHVIHPCGDESILIGVVTLFWAAEFRNSGNTGTNVECSSTWYMNSWSLFGKDSSKTAPDDRRRFISQYLTCSHRARNVGLRADLRLLIPSLQRARSRRGCGPLALHPKIELLRPRVQDRSQSRRRRSLQPKTASHLGPRGQTILTTPVEHDHHRVGRIYVGSLARAGKDGVRSGWSGVLVAVAVDLALPGEMIESDFTRLQTAPHGKARAHLGRTVYCDLAVGKEDHEVGNAGVWRGPGYGSGVGVANPKRHLEGFP